jgi:hypothetical protein
MDQFVLPLTETLIGEIILVCYFFVKGKRWVGHRSNLFFMPENMDEGSAVFYRLIRGIVPA